MTVLLQVSDPHFGTEQPHVVRALLTLAREQRPEVVVMSGDLTQRARRQQFEGARRFASQLAPAAVLATPGNHDIPLFNVVARVLWPYAGFVRAFGRDLEPVHETDDALVVCVNTTHPRRHKDGELGPAQVDKVATRLRLATDRQVRIVVLHHPVVAAVPSDVENVVQGSTTALEAWSRAGADIVMGGHVHLPYVTRLRERLPDLPRETWAVQAGTSVSHRTRGNVPNSINVLRCGAGPDQRRHCVVERWDHDTQRDAFRCIASSPLQLSS